MATGACKAHVGEHQRRQEHHAKSRRSAECAVLEGGRKSTSRPAARQPRPGKYGSMGTEAPSPRAATRHDARSDDVR